MKRALGLLIVAVIGTSGASARAEPAALTGIVFVSQPVRTPVAPADVAASAPFVPAGVAERTGTLDLDAGRAAAFWLDPLDVVRVRQLRGGARDLRFARVLGGGTARARLDEPGAPAGDGVTWLAQPPGRGDVWMVWAERPVTLRIERPVRREGKLIWEEAQRALLAWVDAGGALPALPLSDGTQAFALRLRAEALLAGAIAAAFPEPRLGRALTAWRKASLLAGLTVLRPLALPYLRPTSVDDELAGLAGEVTLAGGDRYRRLDGPTRRWSVTLAGPGVLRVEARALFPAQVSQLAPPLVEVAISSGGALLGRRAVQAQPAMAGDARQPPPAFPRRVPLRARAGDFLGDRVVVAVPLYPGENRYELEVAGGPLALRVTTGHRRTRMGEALSGVSDGASYLAAARAALAGEASPGAALAGRLLDELDGRAPRRFDTGALPPLLQLAAFTGESGAEALVRALPAGTPPELVWTLVVREARRLYGRHQHTALRALLHATPGVPPAPLLPALVELLPQATPLERLRSRPVAALDVAWREDTMSAAVIQGYRAAWRGSSWALVPPARGEGERAPPAPASWLVEASGPRTSPSHAEEPPRPYDPGGLWRLPLGERVRVRAAASLVDPGRAAVLELLVEAVAGGPLRLRVDGRAFTTRAAGGLERLEVALAPGDHELELVAPAGTLAFASLPPAEGASAEGGARVRRYWPVGGVRYPLPGSNLAGPVQVCLRTLATGVARAPVQVTVYTDVGAPTTLTLWPGSADPAAHALAAPGPASGEITLVLRPPARARELWIESSAGAKDAQVFAQVSVRRDRSARIAAGDAAPPAPPSAAGMLGKVAALSRALTRDPRDPAALVRRAELLLDLGQAELARHDLLRLVALPAPRQDAWLAAAEDELITRLDAWSAPTHLVLPAAAAAPVPIAPALLALAPDDPPAVAAFLAARALADRGDLSGAGLALIALYQTSGRWQVGLAALDLLAEALAGEVPPGTAAVTYGLAQRLRVEVDHPRLRRTLVLAAARSRWHTLEGTEANAGQERVWASAAPEPLTPLAATREALLAPPWPQRQAHTLGAGQGAALELSVAEPTQVSAQVFCLELKPGAPAGAACALEWRVDDGRAQRERVPAGRASTVTLATLAPGRHVVELALDDDDGERHLASLRFAADRALPGLTAPAEGKLHPIRLLRRHTAYVASAAEPIEVTVLGPAALWVQARALQPEDGARDFEVVATPRRGRAVRAGGAFAAGVDAEAHGDPGRALALSPARDVYLVLPEAGAYQVRIAPARGKLVARLALREDRAGKPARPAGPWWLAASAQGGLFALPAQPPPLGDVPGEVWSARPPASRGTLSAELAAGQESRDDEDRLPPLARARGQAELTWRLRPSPAQRVWLRASGLARLREATALVLGGAADVHVEGLPLGLFAELDGRAFTQALAAGRAWNLDAGARLGRRFRLAGDLVATPRLEVRLGRPPLAPAGEELDPDVGSDFRFDHPRRAVARLAFAWFPWQDYHASVGAAATANADFATVDHASFFLEQRALLPVPVLPETLVALDYRPSYRFADDDRPMAFLRHDLALRLEWSVWTGPAGRLVLSVWDQLFVAPALGDTRHVFGASLRFDLTGGRGLIDFQPDESLFHDLIERRLWAASPPDGP